MTTVDAAPQLRGIALISHDARRLARFYVDALSFRCGAPEALTPQWCEEYLGVAQAATRLVLALGRERVELIQFEHAGPAYPADARSSDLCFQHFAIVVGDMPAAYRHLTATADWRAISTDGPVLLPPSSGGVYAFKFRDPDGHPLELLAFPDAALPARWRHLSGSHLHWGIDHSAIGVADTATSIAFYTALGMPVSARSHNVGSAQAQLDDVPGADVDVVALAASADVPHVELLGYRAVTRHAHAVTDTSVAATRLLFARDMKNSPAEQAAVRLTDPDGHRLIISER